jgi:hypothetical protein
LLGWRDIARSTDDRTTLAAQFPSYGVGHTNPLMFPRTAAAAAFLSACLASFVLDFVTRQKIAGTHLTYGYMYQLPVLHPSTEVADVPWLSCPFDPWVQARVLELTYTSHDMAPFANDLGDTGTPFHWIGDRRALLRAELDAASFHLYGIDRTDVDYIMDTFPILKRKDEAEHAGAYRTKELILDAYDRMATAAVTGDGYETRISPPPGQGPRHPVRGSDSATVEE